MRYKIFFIAAYFLLAATASAQQQVYVLPVLHGLHKTNQQYNYDSLRAVVQRLQPDVIAVEIRNEDIGKDTAYLKKNYPYKMWMMGFWFPQAVIAGFDWLGNELEGKTVPDRYWAEQSRIKALERRLSADTTYNPRLESCRLYQSERLQILSASSLKNILHSRDALLIRQYYQCLEQYLKGSPYEELTQFYQERNHRLQQNVRQLAGAYPDKTIVVLTGDDHYPYLVDYLKKFRIAVRTASLL